MRHMALLHSTVRCRAFTPAFLTPVLKASDKSASSGVRPARLAGGWF